MSKTRTLLFRIVLSAAFGVLMFWSDILMDALPNVHLLAMFIVTFTVVYRVWALLPIYVYVFLNGLFYGFTPTWIPYLYIWTILWALAMLIPRKMHPAIAAVVYILVCGLHGIAFGTLYAPMQIILFFDGNWSMLPTWIAFGLPFDVIHCIGNLCAGTLVLPLVKVLMRLPGAVPIKQKIPKRKALNDLPSDNRACG